jgi:hypothetical protein
MITRSQTDSGSPEFDDVASDHTRATATTPTAQEPALLATIGQLTALMADLSKEVRSLRTARKFYLPGLQSARKETGSQIPVTEAVEAMDPGADLVDPPRLADASQVGPQPTFFPA